MMQYSSTEKEKKKMKGEKGENGKAKGRREGKAKNKMPMDFGILGDCISAMYIQYNTNFIVYFFSGGKLISTI